MADISLQLQADNLPSEEVERLFVDGHWKRALTRLRTGENLLLEGCRGVGKTMLMRAAAERLGEEAKNGGKTLGVHSTFKRYLATIPPPGSAESDALATFKAWVNSRILGAVRERILTTYGEDGLARAGRVSGVHWSKLVSVLETAYKGGSPIAAAAKDAGLSEADFQALQGYTYTSELLQEARKGLGLQLLVLLLDDAAHALDTRAQGAFFTLVKALFGPGLAFKISVYPAVTRYGMDFSYGHDATVVSLVEVPGEQSMAPFFDMLDRRSQMEGSGGETSQFIRQLLSEHPDWVRLLIYCANGNPRGVLKLVAQFLTTARDQNSPTYEDLRTAINYVTDRHLENMIPGIIKDIDPRLMKAAEELLERFRERIQSSPVQGEQPRMFLAISNSPQIPYLCAAATRLLVSANVLTYAAPQRLSNRDNGSSYLLHPGFVFRDNVLGRSAAPDRWLHHFGTMSPKIHAEVSKAATLWEEVRQVAMEEPSARCLSGHPMMDASVMCDACGAPANPRGPVAIVLEKQVDVLELSDAIKTRLRGEGLTTVGRVFEATDDQLDAIAYIGERRVKEIRSAVEAAVDEYFAG